MRLCSASMKGPKIASFSIMDGQKNGTIYAGWPLISCSQTGRIQSVVQSVLRPRKARRQGNSGLDSGWHFPRVGYLENTRKRGKNFPLMRRRLVPCHESGGKPIDTQPHLFGHCGERFEIDLARAAHFFVANRRIAYGAVEKRFDFCTAKPL